jgi:hypothetical protein
MGKSKVKRRKGPRSHRAAYRHGGVGGWLRFAADLRTGDDLSGKGRIGAWTLGVFGLSYVLGGLVGFVTGESFGGAADKYWVWGVPVWLLGMFVMAVGTIARSSGRAGYTDD